MTEPEQLSDEQRNKIVQCLVAEHSALMTARGSTVFESSGRVTMYLSSVSSVVVALSFIGQISNIGNIFFVFALILLPTVFFIGLVTFDRTLQSSVEDSYYARGINRIRHFYVELAPAARPYFLLSTHDDQDGALASSGLRPNRWQVFLTTASLVAVVNSVIAGVFIALLLNQFFTPSLAFSSGLGIAVFGLSLWLHQRHQTHAWNELNRRTPVLFPSTAVLSHDHR